LTLVVSKEVASKGVELRLDEAIVGRPAWGLPVPIDPGDHVLAVTVAGTAGWSQRIHLGPGEQRTVEVLQPLASEAPQGPQKERVTAQHPASLPTERGSHPATADEASHDGRRFAGYIVGGAGLVGIGLGTFFGLRALSEQNESKRDCPARVGCESRAISLSSDANRDAWIADVAIGVGLAAAGVGAYLVLTSSRAAPPAPTGVRRVGHRPCGTTRLVASGTIVSLQGEW
jgi:hypothetical protein